MSLLRQLNGSKSLELRPETYRGGLNDTFFWDGAGREHVFRYTDNKSSLTAYEKCPPLSAVINKKVQAYMNGKTWILNTQGKAKGKEATGAEATKIRKLMARPNPLQNQEEFEAQQQYYIELFGYSLVLTIMPAGFEAFGAVDATALWNIPPYMLTFEETNKLFYQTDLSGILKNVKLVYRETTTNLDVKKITFFKDTTPNFNTFILPESKVRALQMVINNVIGALDSRNILINQRGAMGIFSSEPSSGQYVNMPMTDVQKEEVQDGFRRYGLRRNQWQYIITTATLKWQPIGKPVAELMLFEEVADGTKMICDAYGVSPALFGLIDPTFNNFNTAEKGLYQNTIIPAANRTYSVWNELFQCDRYGIRMEKDYSHVPILQENDKERADARAARNAAYQIEWLNGLCTLDEWRLANGDDPLPDGRGEIYYTDLKKDNATTTPTDPQAA